MCVIYKRHDSCTLNACQRCGQLSYAMSVFQTMVLAGHAAPREAYHDVMAACAKARDWQLAQKVFEALEESGRDADIVSYNILMSTFVRASDAAGSYSEVTQLLEQPWKLLEQLQVRDIYDIHESCLDTCHVTYMTYMSHVSTHVSPGSC